jgi:hypothetical protein
MPDCRRPKVVVLGLLLFGVGCGARSQGGVDGGVPADANEGDIAPALDVTAASDGGADADAALAPVQCRFAIGDSGSLSAKAQLINQPSERLSAPPGGMWWLGVVATNATVVAERDGLPPVTLQVVRHLGTVMRVGAVLRVPTDLAPGSRLRVQGRELVVTAAEPTLSFEDIRASFAYRPDLGGTGVSVHIPPEQRSRVMIAEAFVGPTFANVYATTQVLAGLSMADAPRLCSPAVPADADEIFVPLWTGEIRAKEGLWLSLVDVDGAADGLFGRLCLTTTAGPNCQVQLPPP